jgi:hypothetical protein
MVAIITFTNSYAYVSLKAWQMCGACREVRFATVGIGKIHDYSLNHKFVTNYDSTLCPSSVMKIYTYLYVTVF